MERLTTRARFLVLALVTMTAGLGVHFHGAPVLGYAVRDIIGDALWAMMIYWLVSAVVPRVTWAQRAGVAFAICAAVEVSQLYHAPSIDAMRRSILGHLVLGSGFDARDFVSYAAGIAAAFLLDRRMFRRTT